MTGIAKGGPPGATSTELTTHDTDIKADIGDFSGQTNLKTLLAALGIPDTASKPLYTCLVTDRLDSGTYGLSALKTILDTIPTTAMRGTDNAALASVLGALADSAAEGAVTEADTAMAYIKQLVTAIQLIPTTAMRGTDSAFLASVGGTLTDAAADGAVTEVDTMMAYVKQLVTAAIAEAASTAKVLCSMDFWSDVVEEIAVTGAQSTIAITGGNVVVADLPASATITRAIAMMKFRIVENTFAGVNKLDAAAALPMQLDDAGNTGWVTCIDFVDDAFTLAASTREGGDIIIGDNDVSARVDGNDTYDFQWLNAKADQANLQFNDVQMGLRIWYSI